MSTAFLVIQIIISVVLIAVILLQSQGTGLGSTWGGGGESYHTKRGVEKVLLYVTIFCIIAFAIFSLLNIVAR
ncbi:MAG: preprotein translocase subunit SecG [Patescibacteria group bacterium]